VLVDADRRTEPGLGEADVGQREGATGDVGAEPGPFEAGRALGVPPVPGVEVAGRPVGQAEQAGRRQQLASTPVTFDYRAGRTGGRLERAVADAGDNFVGAVTTVLIVLVTLLPWLAALLLLWLAWRWLRRRIPLLRPEPRPAPGAEPSPPPEA
jgi:hypothetical protein